MGDLIGRIMKAIWNLFFGWTKDALSTATPEERSDLEATITDFLAFGMKEYLDEVERWKAEAREVSPDVAWTEALTIAELGKNAYAKLSTAGAFLEVLSAGQVESVATMLREFGNFMGVDDSMEMMLKDPIEIGIRTPNRYYLNDLFKPMIPTIQDQIRFAVREAYPGVSIEAIPAEMEKWIGYLGYSKFWADAYWNAHWLIPTLEQARELWWRGKITQSRYMDMLRLSDHHPDFNDMWLELAWGYPGKIDTRWMYEWNIIDRAKMKEFVAALGIHPDWQEYVTDAYVKNILRDEVGRIRSQLITHYREGFLSRAKLSTELSGLGFRSEVVDMSLREADLRIELEDKTEWLKVYEKQFTTGVIAEEAFISSLTALGMTTEAINRKLELAKTKIKA